MYFYLLMNGDFLLVLIVSNQFLPPVKAEVWKCFKFVVKQGGLKCRSQATGQVTGQAAGHRSGYRSQATGQVTGQITGHRSGHRSDHRSHTKTHTKLFLIDILLYKNRTSQGTSIIFFLFWTLPNPTHEKIYSCWSRKKDLRDSVTKVGKEITKVRKITL